MYCCQICFMQCEGQQHTWWSGTDAPCRSTHLQLVKQKNAYQHRNMYIYSSQVHCFQWWIGLSGLPHPPPSWDTATHCYMSSTQVKLSRSFCYQQSMNFKWTAGSESLDYDSELCHEPNSYRARRGHSLLFVNCTGIFVGFGFHRGVSHESPSRMFIGRVKN